MTSLIWAIVAVLVVLWLLGLIGGVGGNLIFLLLLLAIVGVLYNLLARGISRAAGHHHHTTEVTEVERHDVCHGAFRREKRPRAAFFMGWGRLQFPQPAGPTLPAAQEVGNGRQRVPEPAHPHS